MKLSLRESLNEVLYTIDNIENYSQLEQEVIKLSETKWRGKQLKNYLLEEILNYSPEFLLDKNENIVSKKKLFKNARFRINLQKYELEKGILIFGHRFLPFLDSADSPDIITLIDKNDNEIQMTYDSHLIDEILHYFSFLSFYDLADIYEVDEDNISFDSFDLTDWLLENEYKKGDSLLIETVDYENSIFRILKVSRKELSKEALLIKHRDLEMDNAILSVCKEYFKFLSVEDCLTLAFSKCKADLIQNPGSAISKIVSESKTIELSGRGIDVCLVDKERDLVDEMIQNFVSEKLPIMGSAKTMNAILDEIGNSFSENFMIVFLKTELFIKAHREKKLDRRPLLEIILGVDDSPFYNEKQQKNFNKAYSKIVDSVTNDYLLNPINQTLFDIMDQIINIKLDLVEFLRTIDRTVEDVEKINYKSIKPLQELSIIIDDLLEAVSSAKSTNIRLIAEVIKILKEIKNHIHDLFDKLSFEFGLY